MMEQLYIVLDKRLEAGKPFVIFGNKAPTSIDGLAPRILAILEGSLIWELEELGGPKCGYGSLDSVRGVDALSLQ